MLIETHFGDGSNLYLFNNASTDNETTDEDDAVTASLIVSTQEPEEHPQENTTASDDPSYMRSIGSGPYFGSSESDTDVSDTDVYLLD